MRQGVICIVEWAIGRLRRRPAIGRLSGAASPKIQVIVVTHAQPLVTPFPRRLGPADATGPAMPASALTAVSRTRPLRAIDAATAHGELEQMKVLDF